MYFIGTKAVVLEARDPESFRTTVEALQKQFPLRKLYLSSTNRKTG